MKEEQGRTLSRSREASSSFGLRHSQNKPGKTKRLTTAVLALFCAALIVFLSACNGSTKFETPTGVPNVHPEVTITMEDGNVIKLELYPEYAPNTVCNFVALVEAKYYDGLIFHRVQKDFMIQGGDPAGTGSGESGFTIQGEFKENGYEKNELKHEEGVISMARLGENTSTGEKNYDTASNQFFIVDKTSTNNTASLDGKYAAFGKVTEGIEHVHTYAARNTNASEKPYDTPKIKTVTVDTKGKDFPDPIRSGSVLPPDYLNNPTTAPTTTAAPTTSLTATTATTAAGTTTTVAPTTTEDYSKRMTATITMEDGGKIVMALYPEKAPNTVQNFVDLVKNKFYNGLVFHRVIQDFMVQGGDKFGTGSSDLGWSIDGEYTENGCTTNDLSYDEGVVGMARTDDPNSASSQFFITTNANNKESLDGKYAAFAKVIEGMDVIKKIAASVIDGTVDANGDSINHPLNPPKIKTITVDTKGTTVPVPQRNIKTTAAQ
jgi:peptidyl-prolyl cis-trans isomerase B (cyclophilin B)